MSPSSFTESWLCGPKDCQLYTRTYKADQPKAVVVFVHGFNEHIGRYEHVHSVFKDRGITVFCYDQRGFGKTALDENKSKDSTYGKTSWKDQAADIEWAVKYAHGEFGDLPTFLVGHSMVRLARRDHVRRGLDDIRAVRSCLPSQHVPTDRQIAPRSPFSRVSFHPVHSSQ